MLLLLLLYLILLRSLLLKSANHFNEEPQFKTINFQIDKNNSVIFCQDKELSCTVVNGSRNVSNKGSFKGSVLWSESYLWKHLFLLRGFLLKRRHFHVFHECLKIQRQRIIIEKKIKILLNINYIRMSRKIIVSEFVWKLRS